MQIQSQHLLLSDIYDTLPLDFSKFHKKTERKTSRLMLSTRRKY